MQIGVLLVSKEMWNDLSKIERELIERSTGEVLGQFSTEISESFSRLSSSVETIEVSQVAASNGLDFGELHEPSWWPDTHFEASPQEYFGTTFDELVSQVGLRAEQVHGFSFASGNQKFVTSVAALASE